MENCCIFWNKCDVMRSGDMNPFAHLTCAAFAADCVFSLSSLWSNFKAQHLNGGIISDHIFGGVGVE